MMQQRGFLTLLLITLLLGSFSVWQVAPTIAQETPNANVIDMAATLNLRSGPGSSNSVIVELSGRADLIVLGRSRGGWLYVRTLDGMTGWVSRRYVELRTSYTGLPILNADGTPDNNAPAETSEVVTGNATAATAISGNARVQFGITLNLRAEATTSSAVIAELASGTPLNIIGQNASGNWLNVETPSGTGWVAERYVERTSNAAAPITTTGDTSSNESAAQPPIATGDLRAIYARGQRLGNVATNFAKVGDSITVSEYAFAPIAYAPIEYGPYGHLAGIVGHFMQGDNSFMRNSQAARHGWTSADVLNPNQAGGGCQAGETPLECEYRISRPSIALILFGSNDVAALPSDQYAANLNRIVEISIDRGVIPVLSTIPYRVGYADQIGQFNNIVRQVAAQHGVPVWDYGGAMWGLPDHGLSVDGLHPSNPPQIGLVVNFTDEIKYGYTLRNLTALQVLHSVWSQIG